jgi:hypothetical protein
MILTLFFFHIIANNTRRRNIIYSLKINNNITFNIVEINKRILDYAKSLLGIVDPRLVSLNSQLWDDTEQLSIIS